MTSQNERSERVERLVMFLDTLPYIEECRWQKEGKHYITEEWICGIQDGPCGTFEARGFVGDTPEDAAGQLLDYLDQHVGHQSAVGNIVTESGWPNLDRVKDYLTSTTDTKDAEHTWTDVSEYCVECGCHQDDIDALFSCEPEDGSIWCAPGQSFEEMLELAAERDS